MNLPQKNLISPDNPYWTGIKHLGLTIVIGYALFVATWVFGVTILLGLSDEKIFYYTVAVCIFFSTLIATSIIRNSFSLSRPRSIVFLTACIPPLLFTLHAMFLEYFALGNQSELTLMPLPFLGYATGLLLSFSLHSTAKVAPHKRAWSDNPYLVGFFHSVWFTITFLLVITLVIYFDNLLFASSDSSFAHPNLAEDHALETLTIMFTLLLSAVVTSILIALCMQKRLLQHTLMHTHKMFFSALALPLSISLFFLWIAFEFGLLGSGGVQTYALIVWGAVFAPLTGYVLGLLISFQILKNCLSKPF